MIVSTIHEGIQHMFDKNLLVFALKRNWNEFRDACVHHPKVSDILVDHMNYLRRIYARYSHIVRGGTLFEVEDGLRLTQNL